MALVDRAPAQPVRPSLLTSEGRHALGARALNHPVLTILAVYLLLRSRHRLAM